MIFQPELIQLIHERRKTQTRRPVKPREHECRYHTGRVYKVQPGRGKPGVLQITITHVRQQPLGEITIQDCRREGFKFISEFKAYWGHLHGTWQPHQHVWVITFAVGDLTDRYDQPRLLAARPGKLAYTTTGAPTPSPGGRKRWQIAPDTVEHQDYTTQPQHALLDAGEAIPVADQERYIREGRQHHTDRRKKLREEMQLAARVQEIQRRANTGDHEAKRALHVIQQRVEKAEARTSRDQAA